MKCILEHLNHHLLRFSSLEMLLASFWRNSEKIKIFIIFIIFCTFLWHLYHCPDQFRTEGCEALSFFLRQCECSVKSSCFLQYFCYFWILTYASKILIVLMKVTKITKFWVNLKFNEMHLRAIELSFDNALIAWKCSWLHSDLILRK